MQLLAQPSGDRSIIPSLFKKQNMPKQVAQEEWVMIGPLRIALGVAK